MLNRLLHNKKSLKKENFSRKKFGDLNFLSYIYVYKKNVSDMTLLWSHNFNHNIYLLGILENTIYIQDIENNKILSINLIDGKQQKESYVVWNPDQIIINNNKYSCISNNKLYVINH